MKKLFYIFLLNLVCYSIQAQTSYLGGEGDGHAMAGLKFEVVNSVIDNSQQISVYPSILSSNKYIFVKDIEVNIAYLIDMKGNQFVLKGNNQFLISNDIQSGLYTLIIEKNSQRYYSKIVIIEG